MDEESNAGKRLHQCRLMAAQVAVAVAGGVAEEAAVGAAAALAVEIKAAAASPRSSAQKRCVRCYVLLVARRRHTQVFRQ